MCWVPWADSARTFLAWMWPFRLMVLPLTSTFMWLAVTSRTVMVSSSSMVSSASSTRLLSIRFLPSGDVNTIFFRALTGVLIT